MRLNANLPKTFVIYIRHGKKEGYLRYRISFVRGNMERIMTLVSKISDSSRFVNLDNVKEIASKLNERYDFDMIRVVDEKTKKNYNICGK